MKEGHEYWYIGCSNFWSGIVKHSRIWIESRVSTRNRNCTFLSHLMLLALCIFRTYPSLHPSGVVHWVPEQLNIKAVTGACKLIDGCSLALCSTTVSVVSAGICHRNKVNSIAWLYRKAQPKDSIIYITLHYIHYITSCIILQLWLSCQDCWVCPFTVVLEFVWFVNIALWKIWIINSKH